MKKTGFNVKSFHAKFHTLIPLYTESLNHGSWAPDRVDLKIYISGNFNLETIGTGEKMCTLSK